MIKLRGSLAYCTAICTILILALLVSAMAYSLSSPRMLSHGPNPPPDDDVTSLSAHGPNPPPDDDVTFTAHGPNPPPDDDVTGLSC